MPFSKIKEELGIKNNNSLSYHLNLLQRAWLIERSVELGSSRTAQDPYYSFYAISKFGKNIITAFSQAVLVAVKDVPKSRDRS